VNSSAPISPEDNIRMADLDMEKDKTGRESKVTPRNNKISPSDESCTF